MIYLKIMENNINYGWVCPKCGAVHAPTEKGCQCTSKIVYNVDKASENVSSTLGNMEQMIFD